MSCIYGKDKSTASIVLYPCDIELTRSVESAKSGIKMEAKVSDIYLHSSATTCNIFLDVADMIMKDGQVGGLFFLKIFDFAYYRSVHP